MISAVCVRKAETGQAKILRSVPPVVLSIFLFLLREINTDLKFQNADANAGRLK